MERLGVEVRDEYVIEGDFYDESGYRTTRQLLELAEPPTAVFAASDLMAAGALRAANELGVRVPGRPGRRRLRRHHRGGADPARR